MLVHSFIHEDGTELDEEFGKRITDYVLSHKEEFPEIFEWLDRQLDEERIKKYK